MPLVLLSQPGDDGSGERTYSLEKPKLTIGRAAESDVRLEDRSVADRHAVLTSGPNGWELIDLGFGVSVGGVPLRDGAPRLVRAADVIRVGRVKLALVSIDTAVPSAMSTRQLALRGVQRILGRDDVPVVTVVEGPDLGRALRLNEDGRSYRVGRDEDGDLVLQDRDVSRVHLTVTARAARVTLLDHGSKQGTWLGAIPLEANVEAVWDPPGRSIRIGHTVLALTEPVVELALSAPADVLEESLSPVDAQPASIAASSGTAAPIAMPISVPAEDGAGRSLARGAPPRPEATGRLAMIVASVFLLLSVFAIVWLLTLK